MEAIEKIKKGKPSHLSVVILLALSQGNPSAMATAHEAAAELIALQKAERLVRRLRGKARRWRMLASKDKDGDYNVANLLTLADGAERLVGSGGVSQP